MIARSPAFLVLVAVGVINALASLSLSDNLYGTKSYPATFLQITALRSAFTLGPLVIAGFYAGELVWRDRERRISEIIDASALPSWALLLPVVAPGAGAGADRGAGRCGRHGGATGPGLPRSIPANTCGGISCPPRSTWCCWPDWQCFFRSCRRPSTSAGAAAGLVRLDNCRLCAALGPSALSICVERAQPADRHQRRQGGLGNQLVAAALLGLPAGGTDGGGAPAVAARRQQRRAGSGGAGAAALAQPGGCGDRSGFAGHGATGGWLFVQMNVRNAYENGEQREIDAAELEKLYARYEHAPEPSVTHIVLNVALEPEVPRLIASGVYDLVNATSQPLTVVHLMLPQHDRDILDLRIDGAHQSMADDRHQVRFFTFDRPLAPGARTTLRFKVRRWQQGINPLGDDTRLLANGTFLDNSEIAPTIGIQRAAMLDDPVKRRKHGLPGEHRMARLEDQSARNFNYIANASWVTSDITLSTAADCRCRWRRGQGERPGGGRPARGALCLPSADPQFLVDPVGALCRGYARRQRHWRFHLLRSAPSL
jgi:hypothetical protein